MSTCFPGERPFWIWWHTSPAARSQVSPLPPDVPRHEVASDPLLCRPLVIVISRVPPSGTNPPSASTIDNDLFVFRSASAAADSLQRGSAADGGIDDVDDDDDNDDDFVVFCCPAKRQPFEAAVHGGVGGGKRHFSGCSAEGDHSSSQPASESRELGSVVVQRRGGEKLLQL
jgi:hypothetical protein